MKLTFGSFKHLSQQWGKVLEYRALQEEQTEERLHNMQRRKNVRRISLVAVMLMMLIVPVLVGNSYFGIFRMTAGELILFGIADIGIMGTAIYLSTILIRERWERFYRPFYLGFWGVVFIGLTYLSCRTGIPTVRLLLFFGEIMLLGGVPYFTRRERALMVLLLVAVGTMINWRQHLMWTDVACLVSWGCLGYVLSKVRYDSYIRLSRQRRELKNALLDAETDAMTKLMNRRGLERSLASAIPHCIRNEVPVAILMLDIDNFKRYNDTFGHLQGDECIRKVAGEIRKATRRGTDYSARIGGEEFLVFLTGIGEVDAVKWARKLQENIERLGIVHAADNFTDVVTVSIGLQCGSLRWGEQDYHTMKALADQELYNAKEQGRACISLHGSCYRSEKMTEEVKRSTSVCRSKFLARREA